MNQICSCCSSNIEGNMCICIHCVIRYNEVRNNYKSSIEKGLANVKKATGDFFKEKLHLMEKHKQVNLTKISIKQENLKIDYLNKNIAEKEKLIQELKKLKKAKIEKIENIKKLTEENRMKHKPQIKKSENTLNLGKDYINKFLDLIINFNDVKDLHDFLEIQTLTNLNKTDTINADNFENINNQLSEFRGYIVDVKETTVRYLTFKQNIDRYSIASLNKYIYKILYFLDQMSKLLPIDLPYKINPNQIFITDGSNTKISLKFNQASKDIITGYQLLENNLKELENYLGLNLKRTDIYDLHNFLNIRKLYTGDGKLRNTSNYEVIISKFIVLENYFFESSNKN
jgi:hypothetical protein